MNRRDWLTRTIAVLVSFTTFGRRSHAASAHNEALLPKGGYVVGDYLGYIKDGQGQVVAHGVVSGIQGRYITVDWTPERPTASDRIVRPYGFWNR